MSKKFKRVSEERIKDIGDRAEYLKGKMKDSPYHQAKEAGKDITRAGYEWIYVTQYLKQLNKEETFGKIMESKLFLQIEKDFILFNLHRLDKIALWPYWKFNSEVGQFAMEAAGVEFADEGDEDED
jgi:hypothetical protein